MAANRHGNQDDTIYSNNRFVGANTLIIIFGNSTDDLKTKRRRFFTG